MGLKDLAAKARDLVMEDDPTEESPTTQVSAPVVSPIISAVSAYVDVDPEIKARIEGVARGANQQSYNEFSTYLAALLNAGISDEGQRYRGALSTAASKGFQAEEVLRGLDVILNALNTHESQFNQAVPQQITEKVGAREQEVNAIDRSIQDKKEAIARLQQELQKLNGERQVKFSAISQERDRIETAAKKFSVALNAVKKVYAQEREKIAQYSGKVA